MTPVFIEQSTAAADTALHVNKLPSPAAAAIARGVARLLACVGLASLAELTLPNARRADIVGLSETGEIWIVEVKSGVEDFRSDVKWPEYRDFCDRLFFAVSPSFPRGLLPPDTGLIVADRYGAEIVRQAPLHKLPSARRKAIALHFARGRLLVLRDPEAGVATAPRT